MEEKTAKTLALIYSITLITAFLLGVYNINLEAKIENGPYPGAPTFTIWRTDNVYYAKNAYNEIVYAKTTLTETLNTIIPLVSGTGETIQVLGTAELKVKLQITGKTRFTLLFNVINSTTTDNTFDVRGGSSHVTIKGKTLICKNNYVSRAFQLYQANHININVESIITQTKTDSAMALGCDAGQATYNTVHFDYVKNFGVGVYLGSGSFGNTISINKLENPSVGVKLCSVGSGIHSNVVTVKTMLTPTKHAFHAGGTAGVYSNTMNLGWITGSAYTNGVLINYLSGGNNYYSFIINAEAKTALNVSSTVKNDYFLNTVISDVTTGEAIVNYGNITCTNTAWDLNEVTNTGTINYANHYDGVKQGTYTFVDNAGTYSNVSAPPQP